MTDYEKLGVFYLGKSFDLAKGQPKEELLLYDSKDLLTHAVCVGMTGSGKTGLCVSLLEEAAIDGIPALVIDPKGDLPNLLLTFPELRVADFAHWVNEDEARRQGVSREAFAEQQAELWKNGLKQWGQDGSRIQGLRQAADVLVYTPGSSAGLPVSILRSFAAPPEAIRSDAEALRERASATATSLLSLLAIEAEPLRSREHILLSTILHTAWSQGQDLDLPGLIQQVQSPPVQRLGVMELETIFPAKDRFELAVQFNNLLATPGFAAWLEGDPLDIPSLLYGPGGKPRIAIFSIAHLNDAERMFFVSLLLQQTVAWVRSQPGTTSLRALVFMDEIFGYFPPVANPPAKQPLLTLLKQARAYGVGIVLATQNPVDLDYKGLANAGTWFIGRLQTERDKARLLDGLEGASAGQGKEFNRQSMAEILGRLSQRVFLMNNVHDDRPEVFQVRWALSYLRGPMTREQIKQLMKDRKVATTPTPVAASAVAASAALSPSDKTAAARPVLPQEIPQLFLPLRMNQPDDQRLLYRPLALGCATLYFSDTKAAVDHTEELCLATDLPGDKSPMVWNVDAALDLKADDLDKEPAEEALYAPLPPSAAKVKSYDAWKKSLIETIYRTRKLTLLKSTALGEISQVGESEHDFRVRLQQAAREERDRGAEKLRQKYAPKIATLQDRLRRAEQAVEREEAQATQSQMDTAVSVGGTLLGALFGRRKLSATKISKAGTSMRSVGRSMKESRDVAHAQENVRALYRQLADLESQFNGEVAALADRVDPALEQFAPVTVKLKKNQYHRWPNGASMGASLAGHLRQADTGVGVSLCPDSPSLERAYTAACSRHLNELS